MSGEHTSRDDEHVVELGGQGFWLMLEGEKLYLAFSDFPWFAKAEVGAINDVLRPSEDHLYWPQLDIDLSIASIRNPQAFPLMAKAS